MRKALRNRPDMAERLAKHAEVAEKPLRGAVGRVGENLETGNRRVAPRLGFRQLAVVGDDELRQLDHWLGGRGCFLREKPTTQSYKCQRKQANRLFHEPMRRAAGAKVAETKVQAEGPS